MGYGKCSGGERGIRTNDKPHEHWLTRGRCIKAAFCVLSPFLVDKRVHNIGNLLCFLRPVRIARKRGNEPFS